MTVRLLHTADWHVGKVLKGRQRLDEHRRVLDDIARAAAEEDVDVVLLAGDVFDTAAPTPEAQQIVMRTLLALRQDGRHVVVEAGNHDNPRQLDVFRPLLGELGITVVGTVRRPSDGGRVELRTRTGELARIAVLPFISHRTALSLRQVMTDVAADNSRDYSAAVRAMVGALTEGFDAAGAVNLLMSHATLVGGGPGGGERQSHIFDYAVPSTVFPVSLHYVALGHLHRRQQIPGPAPTHYSGAPLQVDFGEAENAPVVVIVEVTADTPAVTHDRPISGGRRLRTVTGTLEQLAELDLDEEDWLKVIVSEKPRAGLSDDVRALLPGAIDVRVHPDLLAASGQRPRPARDSARGPIELFGDFVASRERADAERLTSQFAALLDEMQRGDGQHADGQHGGVG